MPKYAWLQPTFKRISEDASAERLSHALLLNGVEGIGVPEFAGEVAAYRLCFSPIVNASSQGDVGSCGQCKSCVLLKSGTHPDLKILEPEGAAHIIKVDQVRELVNFMSQTPQIGDWKVAVIRPAHRMNMNAANALLKVLEEPPGQSLLLLATERPQMLLPTVRSRCMQVRLPSPNLQQTKDFLASIGIEGSATAEATEALGAKPMLIADWVNSDLMSSWKLFANEIKALETRQSSAVKVAMALKDIDTVRLVNWMLEHAAVKMKNSLVIGQSPLENRNAFEGYEKLYSALIETKQTLDSGANPNPQLTLESVLLDWPVFSRSL